MHLKKSPYVVQLPEKNVPERSWERFDTFQNERFFSLEKERKMQTIRHGVQNDGEDISFRLVKLHFVHIFIWRLWGRLKR